MGVNGIKNLSPNPGYKIKLWSTITIIAVLVFLGGLLLAFLIGLDKHEIGTAVVILIVIVALNFLWYLPGLILIPPYYRSLFYEIQDDEVIVRAGIWTKSIKHVPYRTVTNLTIRRDILDRLLGIGTLRIQTAGMSGESGAEESLVGLTDVQEVYEMVVAELRRFRGGMAPTTTEMYADPTPYSSEMFDDIRSDVKAIRNILENKNRIE